MNIYHIYVYGIHMETISAYTSEGAIIHFSDDYPQYDTHSIEAFEVYVP